MPPGRFFRVADDNAPGYPVLFSRQAASESPFRRLPLCCPPRIEMHTYGSDFSDRLLC